MVTKFLPLPDNRVTLADEKDCLLRNFRAKPQSRKMLRCINQETGAVIGLFRRDFARIDGIVRWTPYTHEIDFGPDSNDAVLST